MINKVICLLVAFCLILGISACGESEKKDGGADAIAMGNTPSYEEKEIGASVGLENPGRNLSMDSQNRLVVLNQGKDDRYLFIDADGNKAAELKCDLPGSVGMYTLDPKDNIYAVIPEYKQASGGGKSSRATWRLVSCSPKGEKLLDLDLGETTVDEKHPGITDAAVDSKGNIYVLWQGEKIEVFNSKGEKARDIPASRISYMETDSKDNLILGAFDGGKSKSLIESLDANGKSRWKLELDTGNLMRGLKYNSKDDTIYMLCEKGIITCTPDGKLQGYVFDLKQSSLLASGTYVNDIAIDSQKNIYALAFQSDSSTGSYKQLLYRYAPLTGEQKPKDSVTLTLAATYSDRFLESAVSEFQKEHPDVKIEIKDYKAAYTSTSESGVSDEEIQRANQAIEDFQKTLNTEIMAGKGPDMLDVTILPYRKYIDKGALTDLSKQMANDKDFDITRYNRKILDACKYKGSLYVLPVYFYFSMIGANKGILDKEGIKIDDTVWTPEDLIKIARSVTKDTNGDGRPDQYGFVKNGVDEMLSYMFNPGRFVDYDKKTADFNSKEFIDLLKFYKTASEDKISNPQVDTNKLWEMTDTGTIAFISSWLTDYQGLIFNQALLNSEALLLNYPSAEIANKRFTPGRIFAINNNSKHKDEAWQFLKLLISDQEQTSQDLMGFAINLDAQKQRAKNFLGQTFWLDTYKNQKGRNIKAVTQTDIDNLDRLVGELGTLAYDDPTVSKIFSDGLKDLLAGNKTAEETAGILQNKISTYLGE